MCEPGRALVAEAESLIVRVDARRGNELFINDGGYGTLFDAAHLGFSFPVRLVRQARWTRRALIADFSFWGPTCDTIDHMQGPFRLPDEDQGRRLHRDRQYRRLRPGAWPAVSTATAPSRRRSCSMSRC